MRYIFSFFFVLLFSCKENIQFSLLETRPNAKNINYVNIDKIQQLVIRDTFNFLIISDTQVAYDELAHFVRHVNAFDHDSVSFVIHAGDFTDYGANFEFNAYQNVIRKLKLPVVGVIGNHDMLGNGSTIYQKMFGQEDFSFTYGKNTFIFQNTNSREVAFNGSIPNLKWLEQQITHIPSEHNVFYVGHVPPFSLDFDKKIEKQYTALQSSVENAKLAIYGHHHNYELTKPYKNELPYLVTPTIKKEEYIWVSVRKDEIDIQLRKF